MDMKARNQYLKVLQERYLKASKKEKGKILDEYCRNTGQTRKYVIRKINSEIPEKRSKRKKRWLYDGEVIVALVKVWEIFDYPCGQRLAPLLREEVERLRNLGELRISNEVEKKLISISPASIDRKLRHEKEVIGNLRRKGFSKPKSLLYQKIPMRLNDWDTSQIGNLEIDMVEHCGSTKRGFYINSLSLTDIGSGWWEGAGIMGKGQEPTLKALDKIRKRTPFPWLEIHPDNDSPFINAHLLRYCEKESIRFSRSRPGRKNDNCFIEQKNWTHVKKVLGYLRYDTTEELIIINDLYENELRLYKNLFQPVMKLKEKIREGGKVHRKYDTPKTPYQRLMESNQISEEKKGELRRIYLSLNPAQLKREIEAKLDRLFEIYQKKKGISVVQPHRRQKPRLVTNYMIQSDIYTVT